jgi:hypothetical protein
MCWQTWLDSIKWLRTVGEQVKGLDADLDQPFFNNLFKGSKNN